MRAFSLRAFSTSAERLTSASSNSFAVCKFAANMRPMNAPPPEELFGRATVRPVLFSLSTSIVHARINANEEYSRAGVRK
jgi:hypothetical protein